MPITWRRRAFRAALDRLLDATTRQSTAIMCAEAVPWRCHRWLISDALVARGLDVIHILALDSTQAARLKPHCARLARGNFDLSGRIARRAVARRCSGSTLVAVVGIARRH